MYSMIDPGESTNKKNEYVYVFLLLNLTKLLQFYQ